MNKAVFPGWSDQIEERIKEINRVNNQIKSVEKRLKNGYISRDEFEVFYGNLCEVMANWTGHTYVGHLKEKHLQKAFQAFFIGLYHFLIFCMEFDNYDLQTLANKVLYNGTLYRYLGHDHVEDKYLRIEPEYNNIFVSWSKKTNNSYIEGKLFGTMTLLTCEVKEPYYGIDLVAFGIFKPNEEEVVFPTIEETIMDIKYIEE